MTTCDRCFKEISLTIVSYFNTDVICRDCKAKEKAHPQYQQAVEAEVAACQRGDYNFQGIGLPADLR